jgi:hypothetical protein
MRRALVWFVIGVVLVSLAACGSGAVKPASTEPPVVELATNTEAATEAVLPTEEATEAPTEAPADTPVPEEPTAAPASDVVVNGITLRVVEAAFDKLYKGTFEAVGVSSSKTTLYVVFGFPDGIEKAQLEKVEKWAVTIKTAKGYVVTKGGDLSHMEPTPEVIWLFAVPRTSKGFSVVFPTGETVNLDSFLTIPA